MLAIASRDNTEVYKHEVRKTHTSEYYAGFSSALDHFAGFCTHGTELAAAMGLVAAYAGFWGQSDFRHPAEIPGSEGPQ